jgi:hypothetical protein
MAQPAMKKPCLRFLWMPLNFNANTMVWDVIIHLTKKFQMNQDSPVISYTLVNWDPVPNRSRNLLLWYHGKTLSVAPPMFLCSVYWGFLPRVKQVEHEADHSIPYSVKVKNEWNFTSTAPVYLHGVVLGTGMTPLPRNCLLWNPKAHHWILCWVCAW